MFILEASFSMKLYHIIIYIYFFSDKYEISESIFDPNQVFCFPCQDSLSKYFTWQSFSYNYSLHKFSKQMISQLTVVN